MKSQSVGVQPDYDLDIGPAAIPPPPGPTTVEHPGREIVLALIQNSIEEAASTDLRKAGNAQWWWLDDRREYDWGCAAWCCHELGMDRGMMARALRERWEAGWRLLPSKMRRPIDAGQRRSEEPAEVPTYPHGLLPGVTTQSLAPRAPCPDAALAAQATARIASYVGILVPPKCDYRSVVGARGPRAKGNQLRCLCRALSRGLSLRKAALSAGASRETAFRVRRIIETLTGEPLLCPCGRPTRLHRGWCSERLKGSPKRRRTLRKMHQRRSRLPAAGVDGFDAQIGPVVQAAAPLLRAGEMNEPREENG